MVAYCRLREAMRDFRASRIREAELLPDTFERLDEVQWYADDMEGRSFEEVRVWIDASACSLGPQERTFPAGFEREEPAEDGSTFCLRLP